MRYCYDRNEMDVKKTADRVLFYHLIYIYLRCLGGALLRESNAEACGRSFVLQSVRQGLQIFCHSFDNSRGYCRQVVKKKNPNTEGMSVQEKGEG